jgi:hypothetical protein
METACNYKPTSTKGAEREKRRCWNENLETGTGTEMTDPWRQVPEEHE